MADPNHDQVALDISSKIMELVRNRPNLLGGEPQLQAQIQCAIADALNETFDPLYHSRDVYFDSWKRTEEDLKKSHNREAALRTDALRAFINDLPHYTCEGKGGVYAHLGQAIGAGESREYGNIDVYCDALTRMMFYRKPEAFKLRMLPLKRCEFHDFDHNACLKYSGQVPCEESKAGEQVRGGTL